MQIGHCYQPWTELQVQYDKTVGACCYYSDKRATWDYVLNPEFNLKKFWNGGHLTKLRKIIKSDDASGTGCENCQFVQYGIPHLSSKAPKSLNSKQKANYERAISNFKQKKIHIDSYPLRYYFNFGLKCNLKCIMCSQACIQDYRDSSLPEDIFYRLERYFQYAERISVIGGEPLIIPEARNFIAMINRNHCLHDIQLGIMTNGTLLQEHFNIFEHIPKINFCISLDSIKSTYEYIRRGSSWEKIVKNIQMIQAYRKKKNFDWQINVSCVVMKSSLQNLDAFVHWCVKNDIPANFVPIVPTNHNKTEDIFNFPQLLNSLSGWEKKFDNSIEIFHRNGNNSANISRLQIMKAKLQSIYRVYQDNPNLFASPLTANIDLLMSEIKEKTFMIWGTGSYYKIYLSKTIQKYLKNNFIGFVDNNDKKWGQFLDNKKIYPPCDLSRLKPETIIIASSMRTEIVEQIRNMSEIKCKIL